jgi:metallo-beta-lactamase family protein
VGGAEELKMFGQYVPIRARVEVLHNLSAHADADEILSWLGHFQVAPSTTWLNHGSPEGTDGLRSRIERHLGWNVRVASHMGRAERFT